MKTITVGAYEAKTNLARLLARVEKGDEVVITKHEKPVAKILPFETPSPVSRGDALRRLEQLAAQVKPGPESAKELIAAGRKL
jgi:prevent-host-death family protein